MNNYDWIIGICSSGAEGVGIFRFRGTKEEVKEKLLTLITEDKNSDKDNWDFGCESIDDIQNEYNGLEYYGYGCYHDYYIDYTARKLSNVYNI